jgi:hypothetical protein
VRWLDELIVALWHDLQAYMEWKVWDQTLRQARGENGKQQRRQDCARWQLHGRCRRIRGGVAAQKHLPAPITCSTACSST